MLENDACLSETASGQIISMVLLSPLALTFTDGTNMPNNSQQISTQGLIVGSLL